MEIFDMLIPLNDYVKEEIETLSKKSGSNVADDLITIANKKYISLADIEELIRDTTSKIEELEELIEELKRPQEPSDDDLGIPSYIWK